MFKSLIDNARTAISGNGKDIPPVNGLFPKVNPAVDGEDCDHDCENCVVHYPKGFKIEESDKLYGHIKGFSTHVLVATGKSDWVRDVADEKGSVMEAIDRCGVKPSNGVTSDLFLFAHVLFPIFAQLC